MCERVKKEGRIKHKSKKKNSITQFIIIIIYELIQPMCHSTVYWLVTPGQDGLG